MKPLRILVEPSTYTCLNVGDLAMLQILVSRFNALCPEATLFVITRAPEVLKTYFPTVVPVKADTRNRWLYSRIFPERFYNHAFPFSRALHRADSALKRNYPRGAYRLWEIKSKLRSKSVEDTKCFLDLVSTVDALVFTGMGAINDEFRGSSLAFLDLIGIAHSWGKPIFMFGQGLGPITDQELLYRAKQVLPSVSLIALRENKLSPHILHNLGVQTTRVVVTGDDAIEAAYREAPLGTAIGINLRIARYSGIDVDMLEEFRARLHKLAKHYQAPLVPVPISHNPDQYDPDAIRELLKGYGETDGGKSIDTLEKVFNQVARCRIIVTGSYHAGVFALAQGIPVIGIARSDYYRAKFDGLTEQFPDGCEVILFEEIPARFESVFSHLWEIAPELRAALLASARVQIKQSKSVYQQACMLLAGR